ncbi:hypothetical protein B0H10DRAFT_2208339 [Mycena sp. CBHHK59/15]|nr:hypothetical protein B0H10DRAFT_2208339 [Mycena sp. CBHHK59/15]
MSASKFAESYDFKPYYDFPGDPLVTEESDIESVSQVFTLEYRVILHHVLLTFSFSTTADEVATTFTAEIGGKNVLITGTSLNGICFEAARVISKYASLVIITGYSSERLKLSEDAIEREVPAANIRRLVLDLSSLAAARMPAADGHGGGPA